MALCASCRSMAVVLTSEGSLGGIRRETLPPHGMEWGESCDGCANRAAVVFE